jgi:hypothetical protein
LKAIDLIRSALQMTDLGTAALVVDMREAPLTQPVVRNGQPTGNHPLWILGHIAFLEGALPGIILGEEGEPNSVGHWAPLFAPGTEPKANASLYPSFDEVLGKCRELRARNLKLLDQIGEAGLDRAPKAIPPGFEDAMRTVGQTFQLIALHQMVHYGQIADARRAAGHKPRM